MTEGGEESRERETERRGCQNKGSEKKRKRERERERGRESGGQKARVWQHAEVIVMEM